MDKWQLNYNLTIQLDSGQRISVGMPFTIDLDVTRNTLSSANVCQVRIYNLNELNRNLIRKNVTDYGNRSYINLDAGYGDRLTTIFSGNISQAWSVREGVDAITQIECFDGGFAFVNGTSDRSFPAGTFISDVVKSLMGDLPGVTVGAIGNYPGQLQRGATYSGNTADLLREITGGGFFIDGGKAYALGNGEYISEEQAVIIDSDTGLIGTPVLERDIARFDMIFEPSLNVGRRVQISSVTESNFNGVYKITQVKHRGTIGASAPSRVISSGQFYFYKLLNGVK